MKFIKVLFEYMYIVITSILVGGLFAYYGKEDKVSMATFLLFVFLLSLACLILLQRYVIENNSKVKLPKLMSIVSERYIFEKSSIFAQNSLVAFYHIEDIEEYLGFGYVESVIDNKNLQVIKVNLKRGIKDDYLIKNKKRIMLKPTIPYGEWNKLVK